MTVEPQARRAGLGEGEASRPAGHGLSSQTVIEWSQQYLMPTYRRLPLVPVRGQGCWVWDAEGRAYLDLVSGIGVNAVGHCHPRVVRAVQEQAATLIHCSNLYHVAPQAELARWLAQRTPFERAFFCNSGAEAVEAAIKLARRHARNLGHPGRFEIVAALGSFHGRTLGALSVTGQARYHEGFEPLVEGVRFVPFNDPQALWQAVSARTAAVLLEPVQGEGGIHPATAEFLQAAREAASRAGALLILDEVQSGLGRTGRFFAFEHYGVVPDVVAVAKALGGGLAIGAVLARGPAATAFGPGQHASTFGGNPLACAAALATLQVIEEEGLVERAARMGASLAQRLQELGARTGWIRQVRGLGLMLAVELDGIQAAEATAACLEQGLLVNAVGERTLRLLPPLIIGEEEIDEAVRRLEQALKALAQREGQATR